MRKRLLPAPLMTLALIAMWLLLNRSVSAGQIVLALVFGVAAPALLAPLQPNRPHIRHPLRVARLILAVGRDVIQSNLEVFWRIVRSRKHPMQNAFVTLPLTLRDPNGLAALAMITTVVPGTIWCELARDGSALLLHVLHMTDEAAFIEHYKSRYERPLIDIFESTS